MKILSLIAVIANVILMVLTDMIYSPVLDAPQTGIGTRILIACVLLIQIYFLFFTFYLSFKVYPVFKWVSEKPDKEPTK